jgi:hypothetical protein
MKRSNNLNCLLLPEIFFCFLVIVRLVPAQPVVTTKMSNSEFVGYVPDQIVVNLDSLTAIAIDKISAFQSGRTGIEGLDRLGHQLNVNSLVQRFPEAHKRY